MGIDNLILYPPILVIIMSGMILLNLIRLYEIFQEWEQLSLMLGTLGFLLLYVWILFYNPSIEEARFGLRAVLSGSLAICWHVSYSYYKKFKLKRG